jgi:RsbT co-antagonist protein rsbRD N-terminal domain
MTTMIRAEPADLIESNIEQLIEIWSLAVRKDSRIESDANLSKPELRDHVPAMIMEMCELIRKSETPEVRNNIEARANVYVRFHQGYQGRDLIRELSLLRITLLDYLMEKMPVEPPGQGFEDRHRAAMIINLYLDEEMRYAISFYCSQQVT